MAYEGMIAETIAIHGDKNETISAYVARPLGPGPFPGMVLMHHAPGWDAQDGASRLCDDQP